MSLHQASRFRGTTITSPPNATHEFRLTVRPVPPRSIKVNGSQYVLDQEGFGPITVEGETVTISTEVSAETEAYEPLVNHRFSYEELGGLKFTIQLEPRR